MTKERFWKIIEDTKVKANGNQYKMRELLFDALMALDAKEIYQWGQYYSVYHTLSETQSLLMAAYVTDNGGDDSFDYFRGWLIAQGEGVFLAALADPDSLAGLPIAPGDMLSFEEMMGIGYEVYADKLNETEELSEESPLDKTEIDAICASVIFANEKGLEGKDSFYAQILKRLPNLCAKFGYEKEGLEGVDESEGEHDESSETESGNGADSKGYLRVDVANKHAFYDPKGDSVLPLPDNAHTINSIQIQQGAKLTDISNLIAFTRLEYLKFEAYEETFAMLKDINVLSKLTQLEYLQLSSMPHLTDLGFIYDLSNIKSLMISDMPELTDVSSLQRLEHLETLIIWNCPKLQDIPSLRASVNSLKTVKLIDIKLLKSIDCLRGTYLLENIWIKHNQIEDISPLENNTKIKELDLSRNKISNIEALSMLVNIKMLDLSRNKITDISPLKNLRTAVDLFLSGNKINNVDALSQLKKVTYTLDLSKNKGLADVTPLKKVKIEGLELNRTAVTDLSPVQHVRYVDIRDGRSSDDL